MARHIIRTLDDLLSVPREELLGCMRAVTQAVRAAKNEGRAVVGPVTWDQASARLPRGTDLTEDTPIYQLGLQLYVTRELRDIGVVRVADLTTVTQAQLLKLSRVGEGSIRILMRALDALGLHFAIDPNPEAALRDRHAIAAARPFEELQARLTIESAIVDVGLLSLAEVQAAEAAGLHTIGHVLDLPAQSLVAKTGRRQARGIDSALAKLGFRRTEDTPVERWRVGLVTLPDLPVPDDDGTPLDDLQPWLTISLRRLLEQQGIRTLGELRVLCRDSGGFVANLPRAFQPTISTLVART